MNNKIKQQIDNFDRFRSKEPKLDFVGEIYKCLNCEHDIHINESEEWSGKDIMKNKHTIGNGRFYDDVKLLGKEIEHKYKVVVEDGVCEKCGCNTFEVIKLYVI